MNKFGDCNDDVDNKKWFYCREWWWLWFLFIYWRLKPSDNKTMMLHQKSVINCQTKQLKITIHDRSHTSNLSLTLSMWNLLSLSLPLILTLGPPHLYLLSFSFSLVHQIHFVCLHLWMKRLSSFFVHWWKGHNNNNWHVTFEPNLNINHLDQAAVLASMTSQLTGSPDQSKRRSVIHWYFPLQSKRINTTTANLLRHFWSNNDWIQLAINCDKKSSVTR